MLKRALISTTALVAMSAAALAADLPSRRAPPPVVAVPVFTWTGFYIGANAGGAFSTQNNAIFRGLAGNEAFIVGGLRPRSVSDSASGFSGGGQIGYNYQIGALVIGLEADAAYTDLSRRTAATFAGNPVAFRHDLGYLGTVRGRVGYAFDRVLVYGTGGFAYGDVTQGAVFGPGTTLATGFAGRRSSTETGWAAGGGVEYALPTSFSLFNSSAVTLKAEALYYDLGRRSNNMVTAAGGAGYTLTTNTNGVIARAGINFKFGSF